MYQKSNRFCAIFVFFSFFVSVPTELAAHAKDQSYLYLRIYQESIEGTVEATFKDLNLALNLGLEDDMTLGDLSPYLPQIQAYILKHVSISSPLGSHQIRFVAPRLMPSRMGTFLKSDFVLEGVTSIPDEVDVSYDMIFEADHNHSAFLVVGHNWKAGIVDNEGLPADSFSKNKTKVNLSLTEASVMKGVWKMIKLGIWHIWIGLDHILFLIALVLPSVMRRESQDQVQSWKPVEKFRTAFWYILKIVTFFTLAHSITLSLAALDVINLDPRMVESIIALSIGLAAFHNIKPIFGKREWLIALGFGLFHGLGFASVLGEKGLRGEFLVPSLVGFNVGVEIGQVVIIALVFPILFFWRKSTRYPKLLYYGSLVLIAIAIYWFIERFFEVDFVIDNFIGKVFRKIGGVFHHH